MPILGDRPICPPRLMGGPIGELIAKDPVQRGRAGSAEADAEDLRVPPAALVRQS